MIDRILLDLDGTLVDMVGGVCSRFGFTYPVSMADLSNRPVRVSYYLAEVFNVPRSDIWPHLGRDFWANLEPLPWCGEVLSMLEARFGPENICLLTHPIETDGAVDGKRDWIKKYLPQYTQRNLVGPSKEFCASNRHALVDDHEENVTKFKKAGGQTFLFPAPWNRRFQEHPVTALKEWIDALATIEKSHA